ncbi:unnamed protein product [Vitrella brassicaformis CCMP3155]|uniref:Uncharacterized protein n=1 Tax=Vitrella brassicaformis (strain CCMP3155) TaxID=1169540 RepID=A0A0G4F624_VITBC|nr:unnamed protein product [Vitrella brassicaformis CCMP3155]|eukprot:CEM07952.1 unnamed protein product [Vitrella brassicaformis CCMP3155]
MVFPPRLPPVTQLQQRGGLLHSASFSITFRFVNKNGANNNCLLEAAIRKLRLGRLRLFNGRPADRLPTPIPGPAELRRLVVGDLERRRASGQLDAFFARPRDHILDVRRNSSLTECDVRSLANVTAASIVLCVLAEEQFEDPTVPLLLREHETVHPEGGRVQRPRSALEPFPPPPPILFIFYAGNHFMSLLPLDESDPQRVRRLQATGPRGPPSTGDDQEVDRTNEVGDTMDGRGRMDMAEDRDLTVGRGRAGAGGQLTLDELISRERRGSSGADPSLAAGPNSSDRPTLPPDRPGALADMTSREGYDPDNCDPPRAFESWTTSSMLGMTQESILNTDPLMRQRSQHARALTRRTQILQKGFATRETSSRLGSMIPRPYASLSAADRCPPALSQKQSGVRGNPVGGAAGPVSCDDSERSPTFPRRPPVLTQGAALNRLLRRPHHPHHHPRLLHLPPRHRHRHHLRSPEIQSFRLQTPKTRPRIPEK